MDLPTHKTLSVKVNGHIEFIQVRRKEFKTYPIGNKTIQDIIDFCLQHKINMSDSAISINPTGLIIVQAIYEDSSDLEERALKQREAQYKQYLELKEKFG